MKPAPEADHLLPVGQGDNGWTGPRPGCLLKLSNKDVSRTPAGSSEEPSTEDRLAQFRLTANQGTQQIPKNLSLSFPPTVLVSQVKLKNHSLLSPLDGKEAREAGISLCFGSFQSYRYSK